MAPHPPFFTVLLCTPRTQHPQLLAPLFFTATHLGKPARSPPPGSCCICTWARPPFLLSSQCPFRRAAVTLQRAFLPFFLPISFACICLHVLSTPQSNPALAPSRSISVYPAHPHCCNTYSTPRVQTRCLRERGRPSGQLQRHHPPPRPPPLLLLLLPPPLLLPGPPW
jgi:hypothetical protein